MGIKSTCRDLPDHYLPEKDKRPDLKTDDPFLRLGNGELLDAPPTSQNSFEDVTMHFDRIFAK